MLVPQPRAAQVSVECVEETILSGLIGKVQILLSSQLKHLTEVKMDNKKDEEEQEQIND